MAVKNAKRKLASANIYKNEIDVAIEKDTYANANTIYEEMHTSMYLEKAHEKILFVLEIKSENDSKYFDFEVYSKMVREKVNLKIERQKASKERKEKAEETL